jgi:hypothetical protein
VCFIILKNAQRMLCSDLIVRNSSQSVHQKIQVFVRRLFGANLDGHCKDMATPHSLLSKALGPSEFQQLQEFYAYHPGLPAPHQRAGAGAPPPAAGRAKPRKTPSAGARRAAEAKRREEIYRGFDGSLYQHGHMAAAGQASQKQPAGHVHLTPDQFMHQQHAMGRMPPPASHPALQPPPPSGWASLLTTPPAHVPARRQPPAPQEPVFTGDEPRANKRVPLMVDKLVPEAAIYKRLLDVEELLDRESAKQAWELDDALRDQPSLLRTLRISVCNTHKNQPAMRLQAASKQADSANGDQDSAQGGADTSDWGSVGTTGTPEWTLHILGDALGVEQGSQKLSDFIEKVRPAHVHSDWCFCMCVTCRLLPEEERGFHFPLRRNG